MSCSESVQSVLRMASHSLFLYKEWVYLISSLISIILVITAIPDTIPSVYTPDSVKQQEKQQNTEQQHNHDEHI